MASTMYYKAEDRDLTVKVTDKYCYTRILNKHFNHVEAKHEKSFFDNLSSRHSLVPCSSFEYLTVNKKRKFANLI